MSIVSLFFILIGFAIGRRILRLCKIQFHSLLEGFVFSTGIGLGLVSYLTLTVGLAGLLYRWTCILLLAVLLCFALWEVWEARNVLRILGQKLRTGVSIKKENLFEWVVLAILSTYFFLNLLALLAPPTDLDSLVYHLAVPKIWIQHHKVVYIPYIIGSEFPSTIETLYALGMILASDISAGLIIWTFGLLFILSIFSFCREYLSIRAGLLASAAFYCTPLFSTLAARDLTDVAVGYYAFLGLYAFLMYVDEDDCKVLALSGVAVGFAAASKHTGMIPFIILLTGVLMVEIKRRKLTIAGLKRIALFCLAFLLTPALWYVKSYINTGNPTVIYFTRIFGGRNLLPEDTSNLIISWRAGGGYRSGIIAILTAPLRFFLRSTFTGSHYWLTGAFFLAFAPCLLLIKRVDRNVKYILAYSLGGLILYSFLTTSPRLAIPVFAGLFIAGAYAAYRLLDSDRILKVAVQIVIVASLLFNIVIPVKETSIRLPVVIGSETREQYLDRRLYIYNVIEYANRNLGDDVRILTMDPRGYYLDKPYITGTPIFQGFIRYDGIKDVSQLLDMFKRYGITHLLLDQGYGWKIPFLDDLKSHMTLLYSRNDVYLYRLPSTNGTKMMKNEFPGSGKGGR